MSNMFLIMSFFTIGLVGHPITLFILCTPEGKHARPQPRGLNLYGTEVSVLALHSRVAGSDP